MISQAHGYKYTTQAQAYNAYKGNTEP